MTDLIFSRGMAGLVLVEWFADQQQWSEFGAPLLTPLLHILGVIPADW